MLRVERSFLFNYHDHVGGQIKEEIFMAFFNSAVTILQTLVIALGAGLGIWGATDYSAVVPAHHGGKTVENFTSMCYNSSDRMKYKYIFYTTVWGYKNDRRTIC